MITVHTLVLVGHVMISLFIIALVLLQRGKGAEAGTAFGAGASGTVFGARGSANFLSRTTAVLATLFFMSSLGLAYLGAQEPESTSIIEQSVPTESETGNLMPTEVPDDADLPALPDIDVPVETDVSDTVPAGGEQ